MERNWLIHALVVVAFVSSAICQSTREPPRTNVPASQAINLATAMAELRAASTMETKLDKARMIMTELRRRLDSIKRQYVRLVFSTLKQTAGSNIGTIVSVLGRMMDYLSPRDIGQFDLVTIDAVANISVSASMKSALVERRIRLKPARNWTAAEDADAAGLLQFVRDKKILMEMSPELLFMAFTDATECVGSCERPSPVFSALNKLVGAENFTADNLMKMGKCFYTAGPAVTRRLQTNIVRSMISFFGSIRLCKEQANLLYPEFVFPAMSQFTTADVLNAGQLMLGAPLPDLLKLQLTPAMLPLLFRLKLSDAAMGIIIEKVHAMRGEGTTITNTTFCFPSIIASMSMRKLGRVPPQVMTSCPNAIGKALNKMSCILAETVSRALMKAIQKQKGNFTMNTIPQSIATQLPIETIKRMTLRQLGLDDIENSNGLKNQTDDEEAERTETESQDENGSKGSTATKNDPQCCGGNGKAFWPLSKAIVIMNKIIAHYGKPTQQSQSGNAIVWTLKNVRKFRSLLKGLQPPVLKDLPAELIEPVAKELSNEKCIAFAQGRALVKAFVKNMVGNSAEITEEQLRMLGKFAVHLRRTDIQKLNTEGKTIMQKMFSETCQMLPTRKRDGLMRELFPNLKQEGLTEGNIRLLGGCVIYSTPDLIDKLTPEFIRNSMDTLGKITWSRTQAEKLIAKANITFSKLDIDGLCAMPGLIQGIPPTDIEMINKDALLGALPCMKIQPNAAVAKAMFKKIVGAVSPVQRKRKAVEQDLSSYTGAQLAEIGGILIGAAADDIKTINSAAFVEAIDSISATDNMTMEQLEAFVFVARQAWGAVQGFTPSQLKSLGNFLRGLSPAEIKMTNMSIADTIGDMSRISGYTTEQLAAGWERVKQLHGPVSTLAGFTVANLNYFALAATPQELGEMNVTAYSEATLQLGAQTAWSLEQMRKLAELAIAANGPSASWDSSLIRDIGSVIGGLTAEQLGNLPAAAMGLVMKEALAAIPPEAFAGMSSEQLSFLGADQLEVIREDQINALPSNLQDEIRSLIASSGGFDVSQDSGGCIKDSGKMLQVATTSLASVILLYRAFV